MKICDRCKKETKELKYRFDMDGERIKDQEYCPECYKEYEDLIEKLEKECREENSRKMALAMANWIGSVKLEKTT
jgi:hypothetical protein